MRGETPSLSVKKCQSQLLIVISIIIHWVYKIHDLPTICFKTNPCDFLRMVTMVAIHLNYFELTFFSKHYELATIHPGCISRCSHLRCNYIEVCVDCSSDVGSNMSIDQRRFDIVIYYFFQLVDVPPFLVLFCFPLTDILVSFFYQLLVVCFVTGLSFLVLKSPRLLVHLNISCLLLITP